MKHFVGTSFVNFQLTSKHIFLTSKLFAIKITWFPGQPLADRRVDGNTLWSRLGQLFSGVSEVMCVCVCDTLHMLLEGASLMLLEAAGSYTTCLSRTRRMRNRDWFLLGQQKLQSPRGYWHTHMHTHMPTHTHTRAMSPGLCGCPPSPSTHLSFWKLFQLSSALPFDLNPAPDWWSCICPALRKGQRQIVHLITGQSLRGPG